MVRSLWPFKVLISFGCWPSKSRIMSQQSGGWHENRKWCDWGGQWDSRLSPRNKLALGEQCKQQPAEACARNSKAERGASPTVEAAAWLSAASRGQGAPPPPRGPPPGWTGRAPPAASVAPHPSAPSWWDEYLERAFERAKAEGLVPLGDGRWSCPVCWKNNIKDGQLQDHLDSKMHNSWSARTKESARLQEQFERGELPFWMILRNEEPFCTLCKAPATEEHQAGKKHLKNLQWGDHNALTGSRMLALTCHPTAPRGPPPTRARTQGLASGGPAGAAYTQPMAHAADCEMTSGNPRESNPWGPQRAAAQPADAFAAPRSAQIFNMEATGDPGSPALYPSCGPSSCPGAPKRSHCAYERIMSSKQTLEQEDLREPAPPPQPAPTHGDWKQVWSPEHQRWYYWHADTAESRWEPPPDKVLAGQPNGGTLALKRAQNMFTVGMRVEAQCVGWGPDWYPGVVRQLLPSGEVQVLWDGDDPSISNCPPDLVKPRIPAATEPI